MTLELETRKAAPEGGNWLGATRPAQTLRTARPAPAQDAFSGRQGPATQAGTAPAAVIQSPSRQARPTVTVVIPALNEAENLAYVLPGLWAWADEVILVDGHSTDGTVEVACQLCPGIRIVQQEGPGKGAALRTGFANATGDIIVMLDADGSTDPAEIPAYVGALLGGADFAKGSRFLQGGGTSDMPLYRKLGNWGFVALVRLLFGGNYTDLCYGYNAFWRRVVPHLELDCTGFEVESMMNVRALRAGLSITEVPSFEYKRVYGEGRLRTIPDGWRVLKTILAETQRRARRVRQRHPARQSGVLASLAPAGRMRPKAGTWTQPAP